MHGRVWIWALLLGACGEPMEPADAGDGGGDAAATACTDTADCDDRAFCNGLETCGSGVCTAGIAPCPGGCDEASDTCDCGAAADGDDDGHDALACGGDDCDDGSAQIHPGAAETCDAADEDCDARIDEGAPRETVYFDADGDGYGDPLRTMETCTPETGWVDVGGDCDDTEIVVHPGAEELCNGTNEDCDATIDESSAASCTLGGAAIVACASGVCTVVECAAGRADCNGLDSDGCEIDTMADARHCSSCGNVCDDPLWIGETCIDGACAPGGCISGYHLCADVCRTDTDVTACGASCQTCTAINGTEICAAGACSADCGLAGALDDASWSAMTIGSHTECRWSDPRIVALNISPTGAGLSPAFSPDVRSYRLVIPLASTAVVMNPMLFAPAGFAAMTIDGTAVTPGSGWVSGTLPLGPSTHQVVVTAQDGTTATYTIVVVRGFLPDHYVKASNTGSGDVFGWAIAMSGNTMVVGASDEDSGASGINGNQSDESSTQSGAAYVFVRSGTTWVQQAYLKASNNGRFDWFGASVAISGDTIAIGAPREDSSADGVGGTQLDESGFDSGAVYVFVRSGATWTQQAYIKATNSDNYDEFGTAVALSGSTLVVGAPREDSAARSVGGNQADNSASSSGAIYVYTRSGTVWTPQAYLKASNADAGDELGHAIAISGETIVAGTELEASNGTGVGGDQTNNSLTEAGAAYVFVRAGTVWSQQAYLKPADMDSYDWFGRRVAIDGDTIVVGMPGEDSGARTIDGDATDESLRDAGAAYVFVRSGATWTQRAYLKPSYNDGDGFGQSVGISGAVIVVGAYTESSGGTGVYADPADNSRSSSGAAWVFVRNGTSWSESQLLKASNPDVADRFGDFVAISGSLIACVASYEASAATGIDGNQSDNSFNAAGAVYTFSGL